MAVIPGDLRFYNSNTNGTINLSSEITEGMYTFDTVLDIANDVEKKFWVKNTNSSSSLELSKLYLINGITINNTNGTPIVTNNFDLSNHLPAGDYAFSFPTVNSVIITPPSGVARAAQSIVANGSTLNQLFILDNVPIFLAFAANLTTANTAVIKVNDGAEYLLLAADNNGVAETYAKRTSYANGLDFSTIAAGATKAFWVKQSVPNGINNLLNPRGYYHILQGRAS